MRKRPDIVALILFVVLTAYAAGIDLLIVPVIQSLLATAGTSLGTPSRIAITLSQFKLVPFLVFIGVLVFALKRLQPVDDRVQQARILNVGSLVVTGFIIVQASLFVDLAKTGGQISRALERQTATTTTTAPTGLR